MASQIHSLHMTRNYQKCLCDRCGRVFQPTGSRQSWCSRCRTIRCRTCGTQFQTSRHKAQAGTALYCSRACLYAGRDYRTERNCVQCGAKFISRSTKKTVCDQCCTVACQVCGRTRRVKPYQVSSARYCSRKCKHRGESSFVFTKRHIAFIERNYPYKMSLKEIAEKLGAPQSCVERTIYNKLDLPRCPSKLRGERTGMRLLLWTKDRVIEEVSKLHRQGKANSAWVQKNYQTLHTAAVNRFGSWRAAVEAAGIDYDDVNLYARRRTWTSEDIIAEVRRMAAEGISLRASHARDHHAAVFNAARREPSLGSWQAAVEAAGFDYTEIRGEPYGSPYRGADGHEYPSKVEGKVGERLHELMSRGVLVDVKRQARVKTSRAWRCDFVVEFSDGVQIWLEVDGLGSARSDGEYEDHPKIQYYRRTGRAFAVVRTPGQAERVVRDGARGKITSSRDSPRKIIQLGENRYTDEELIQEVRRVGRSLGRAPTTPEFIASGRVTVCTVRRRIGWDEALMQAGFLPRRSASKEILLGELQRVVSELGRAPSRAEFDTRSSFKAATIATRFGGWVAAVRAAGAEPVYEGYVWSEERVINEITSLNKRLARLNVQHLKADGQLSLYYAAQRFFGTWKAALKAAGLDPRSRVVGWCRRFDACVKCGTTESPHASKGRCVQCYYEYGCGPRKRPR